MIFKARILVVEDNPTNLAPMTYLLKAFGYEPLEARDGVECLEAIERDVPDLVLLDIHLPNMDGYETINRIRAIHRMGSVPVLAVTALAMVGDREKLLAAGFDGYISKPIDPASFVSQLEPFLSPDLVGREPKAKEKSAAPLPSPVERGVTILAVDNLRVNLSVLEGILEPLGFRLVTALSVAEGLALARQSPPDLILSDIHMPKQDGYDFLREVRADPRLKDIPLILMSASMRGELSYIEAKKLEAARFLVRPIDPGILVQEIEAALSSGKGA